MRKLQIVALIAALSFATLSSAADFKQNGLSYTSTGVTFATLTSRPPQTNGTLVFCLDCTNALPCVGGGNGAIAQRINGSWNCLAGATGTIAANAVINAQTTVSLNNVANVTDPAYGATCNGIADDHTALQAALNTGKGITAPVGVTCMTSTTLTVPSNAVVTGNWTLKATAALTGAVLKLNGVSGATVQNITIDGNSSVNTNGIDGLQVSNSTGFLVDGVTLQNTFGNGLAVDTGSSGTVRRSIAQSDGQTTNPIVGCGFVTNGPLGTIEFDDDTATGNTVGFCNFPSNVVGQNVDKLIFRGIHAYSNGTDGWEIVSTSLKGLINDVSVTGSTAACNGWIATGFNNNCLSNADCTAASTPAACCTGAGTGTCPNLRRLGKFQGAALHSPSVSGIGFNQDSAAVQAFTEAGNSSSDNIWDGFDNTPQLFATVNTQNTSSGSCSANCVIWQSGDTFNTALPANSYIFDQTNSTWYQISSVKSSTLIQLASAPGTQTGATFVDLSNDHATISGNRASRNGPCGGGSNGCTTFLEGYGVSDESIGATYSGNILENNYLPGASILGGSYITLVGNSTNANNRATGAVGFSFASALEIQDSFNTVLTGNQSVASSTEAFGVGIGADYVMVSHDAWQNSGGPYSVSGTNNFLDLTNLGTYYADYASNTGPCIHNQGALSCTNETSVSGFYQTAFPPIAGTMGIVQFGNIGSLHCGVSDGSVGEIAVANNCNAACSANTTCTAGGATQCAVQCNHAGAWVETGTTM